MTSSSDSHVWLRKRVVEQEDKRLGQKEYKDKNVNEFEENIDD